MIQVQEGDPRTIITLARTIDHPRYRSPSLNTIGPSGKTVLEAIKACVGEKFLEALTPRIIDSDGDMTTFFTPRIHLGDERKLFIYGKGITSGYGGFCEEYYYLRLIFHIIGPEAKNQQKALELHKVAIKSATNILAKLEELARAA